VRETELCAEKDNLIIRREHDDDCDDQFEEALTCVPESDGGKANMDWCLLLVVVVLFGKLIITMIFGDIILVEERGRRDFILEGIKDTNYRKAESKNYFRK
jgi:hypothetical protein